MLGQSRVENLAKRALRLSQAGETEVLVQTEDTSLTRFANNAVHQNVSEIEARVTIRAVVGKRAGSASTNDLEDGALARAAAHALTTARLRPEDPNFPGLAEPLPIQRVQAFDERTANFSPEARARGVSAVCALAAERKLNAFGAFRTTAFEQTVANSKGVFAYHHGTAADFQTVVMGADGSGRAQVSSWKVGELDGEAMGREAVGKALRAQDPRKIEPGEYTVVVDHYVTDDLLGMLNFYGMSAQAVQEGRSWINDRINQQAMSRSVSIWDDGQDRNGMPLPFDSEGTPRQRVQIVDNGVICGPVYDRYTAAKEGRESTGHATPPVFVFFTGPMAFNLFMAGGDSSVEEMIRSTRKGLYITRFWYTRLVHPRDCVVTGMTRDGLYMIEDGELAYPVKNLRFTQSYVKAMAGVQAVGSEARTLIHDFAGAAHVPALKLESFNFTSSTV